MAHKLLSGVLIAATVLTPVAATAQERVQRPLVNRPDGPPAGPQGENWRDRRNGWQGQRGDVRPDQRGPAPDARQPWQQQRQNWRQDRVQDRRDRVQDRRDVIQDRRDVVQDRRDVVRDRRDVVQDRRDWNRGWRQDRRYNWQDYRQRNRSAFSIGRYIAPLPNYRYRPPSIGLRLGAPFYGNRYVIQDPWRYRLPPVYGSYRWVRYYNDVLLVDMRRGTVVDVIHNVFW